MGRQESAQGDGARKRRRVPRSNVDTKESLLDAAERLFAAHGIQAVSLRMINAAAGARNASAAHYHFRSRETLLRAVARRRMDWLSEQRLELLRRAERMITDGLPDVRAIVEATLLPTFRMLLDDSGGGANYVRFLARAAADPTIRFNDLATESFNFVIATAFAMLRRALPALPTGILQTRMMFVLDVGVLAPLRIDREARHSDGTRDRAAIERFAARLIDYVTGALSAPVTMDRISLASAAGGSEQIASEPTRRMRPLPSLPSRP